MTGSHSHVLPLLRHARGRATDQYQSFTSSAARAADDRVAAEPGVAGQESPGPRGSDQLSPPDSAILAQADQPGQLSVTTSISAGIATIILTGELDLAITPALSGHLARVLDKKPRQLIFDMAGVGFLDCATARLIVSTGGFLPDGQQPVIRCPSYAARRILSLTGLDDYCKIEAQ
jgi:anti-anti-sigma factor